MERKTDWKKIYLKYEKKRKITIVFNLHIKNERYGVVKQTKMYKEKKKKVSGFILCRP